MTSNELESAVTEETRTMPEQESEPAAASVAEAPTVVRKRPRIDLTTDSRERKRGKSMFGILVGTLNKAKKEDHDRSASEAARKRADIDRRLQTQLAEETDNVRRAEELKRDRQAAVRKEEDLKLRETIYLNRRTRLPALAHLLLTSDKVPTEDSDEPSSSRPNSISPLAAPPRTHPPPLYYLPAVLTPAQAAFVEKRKTEVKEAVEKEWQDWLVQRKEGYDEVDKLRTRVEEERRRTEEKDKNNIKSVKQTDEHMEADDVKMEDVREVPPSNTDAEADKGRASPEKARDDDKGKDGDVSMAADGDDAVEY